MREYGVRQDDLAEALGCNKGTICKYLSGETPRSPAQWRRYIRLVPLIAGYRALSDSEKTGMDLPSYIDKVRREGSTGFDAVRLKIDCLTIVAEPRDRGSYFRSIRPLLSGVHFSSDEHYATTMHLKKLGVHLNLNPHDKSLRFIRLDIRHEALVSPEKIREVFKLFVLPFVKPKRIWVTRIDLCIDYPVAVEDFHFTLFFGRYTWGNWSARGGNESLYHGGKESDWRCKVYDKLLERARRGVFIKSLFLTRIEVIFKPTTPLRLLSMADDLCNVFEPFDVFDVPDISSLPYPHNQTAMLVEVFGMKTVEHTTPKDDFAKFKTLLEPRDTIGRFLAPVRIFALQWHNLARRFLRHAGLM